jgi:hypothetical protein
VRIARLVAWLGPWLAVGLITAPARADVTSWLALGGGYGLARNGVASSIDSAGTFSGSIGVGTSPRSALVVGGMFRSVTYVGFGTDIGLGARLATRGFARGDWGFAFDLGLGYRYWGSGNYGQFPVQPVATLGAPWGLQLGVGANVFSLDGATQAVGGFAVLEIDLLRLTLMRQGSTDSAWHNPLPAGGRTP